ncbi:MAG: radical SAM protein [Elusimicrobiota bacterium]|jgi:organic radical activating enzyme|nr:radical SAM protein [Elusimicrobiota bacterium]
MNLLFYKRNLKRYVLQTIPKNKETFLDALKYKLKFILRLAALTFEFYFLKRIYIPYIEVAITTRCSLKCKYCANYINTVEEKYQHSLTSDEFKTYLDNLLCNVSKLDFLKIFGGEPLLNKDLDKILQIALDNKKISVVWLTTSGTIDISDNLISIMKRYPGKIYVNISNYTLNKDLAPRLKTQAILYKCKQNGILTKLDESGALWNKTSEIKYHSRSPQANRNYFLKCKIHCIHILNGKLYPCPKAAIFDLRNIYNTMLPDEFSDMQIIKDKEYIDLSAPVEKEQLIKFYSNADYLACNFCSQVEDEKKEKVIPAIQE